MEGTQKKAPSRNSALKVLPNFFAPRVSDVICAKGKEAKDHPGNVFLMALIQHNLEVYKNADSRTERANLVSAIMETIKMRGGLFVRKVMNESEGHRWADIGPRNTREKIGSGFRDLLPEHFQSAAKAKTELRRRKLNEERWSIEKDSTPPEGKHGSKSTPVPEIGTKESVENNNGQDKKQTGGENFNIGYMPPPNGIHAGPHTTEEEMKKARISEGVRKRNRERFLEKLKGMGLTEEEYNAQRIKEGELERLRIRRDLAAFENGKLNNNQKQTGGCRPRKRRHSENNSSSSPPSTQDENHHKDEAPKQHSLQQPPLVDDHKNILDSPDNTQDSISPDANSGLPQPAPASTKRPTAAPTFRPGPTGPPGFSPPTHPPVPTFYTKGKGVLTALPISYVPKSIDVICAPGKQPSKHPGNQFLQALVQQNVEAYKDGSRGERGRIVSEIAGTIQRSGGLFVRLHKGQWADIGLKNAREKIGEAFRNLLPEHFRSSALAKVWSKQQKQVEATGSTYGWWKKRQHNEDREDDDALAEVAQEHTDGQRKGPSEKYATVENGSSKSPPKNGAEELAVNKKGDHQKQRGGGKSKESSPQAIPTSFEDPQANRDSDNNQKKEAFVAAELGRGRGRVIPSLRDTILPGKGRGHPLVPAPALGIPPASHCIFNLIDLPLKQSEWTAPKNTLNDQLVGAHVRLINLKKYTG